MKTIQIASILNTVMGEILGSEAIQTVDLGNVVDLGVQVENMTTEQFTNFITGTIDHIGRVVFVNRRYTSNMPRILRDGWEYGAILQKISTDLPEANENESWELTDGTSYDPNIYTAPKIYAKYFDKQITFEITMPSITRKQILGAFSDQAQLNSFYSMLYTAIENSMTVKLDSLTRMLISNAIGETIYSDYQGESTSSKSGVKAVNLLKLYNDAMGTNVTAEQAMYNKDFLRFSTRAIKRYIRMMGEYSTKYNIGGQARFTPRDNMHVVLLGDYVDGVDSVLQSDTFHNELTALPYFDMVSFWQGSGTGSDVADYSEINITTASGHNVNQTGIIGIIFDRDALAICNEDRRVTSNWNPKGEFFNEWHKAEARYLMDTNENIVVFFVA